MSVASDSQGRAAAGRPPLLVEAHALTKRFGRTVALDAVDLRVRAGAVVGLVGPNGSGKTTALRIVAGLVQPDGGGVTVGGAPAGSMAARMAMTFVPDEPLGFDELTTAEYAALLRALHQGGATARMRADALTEAFELGHCVHSRLGELSKGQRRKVSLAAGLSLPKAVVVVDEATATLDPEATVVLRAVLRAHAARGGGVLLATQDIRFAETTCDLVVLLAGGRIVSSGAPGRIVARHGAHDLEGAFLSATGRDRLQDVVYERLVAL